MTGLIDEFLPALRNAAAPVPAGLTDGAGRAAGRRFNVYRNNVAVSLTEALEAGFPAVAGLISAENFRSVAHAYQADHPPQSPLLMQYGADFPAFLAAFPPLAHLPYLADVARLELALRNSYHAADHIPLAAEQLAGIAPDVLGATRFGLAPSVRLLRSDWPVLQIWSYTLHPGQPKPTGGAQDVVVLRAAFDPDPHPLPDGAYAFLHALLAGRPLGAATDAAMAEADDFDLAPVLGLLLANNALTIPRKDMS